MLSRVLAFALHQRLLVLIITLAMAVAGFLSFRALPIDAFPDVSTTQVKVIIKAPGMTPEEVEARITVPIEQELLGLPRQKMLRSSSKYALADITLDFEDGTDVYWARQQVSERFTAVLKDLPPGASGGLAPITTPLGEMFMFTLEGPQTLAQKRKVLDWLVRPALRTIPGVADVNSLGGSVSTFEVVPNPAALAARGVTLERLAAAIVANNRNDGAGRLGSGEEALIVRSQGAITSLDDLRAIVIARPNGVPVRVADVAQVGMGELTRYGAVTRNGSGETVEGLVLGLRGANARDVAARVKDKLGELAPSLPTGMTVQAFYDRSQLVDRAIHTVGKALLEAVVLVIVLLLLFLGNVRAAVVVALMLPLSVLGTFLLMRLSGISANLMSLGGLAIGLGLLVDGAVVVVENIESRLASLSERNRIPVVHLIYRAASDVAAPVTSGIAIIVIVFLPLLSLEGLEGKLFGPVALIIVYALSVSLLLSLTIVPVIASWLIVPGDAHEPWMMRQLSAGYDVLLSRVLARPRIVYAVAGTSLAAAAVLFTLLGKTFIPVLDEGDLILQLERLPSISLDQTIAVDLRVQQKILEQVPEVRAVIARSGSDELGLDPMGLNQSDTFLVLKPLHEWRKPDKEWLIGQLRAVMEQFPGVSGSYTQPIDMRVSEMLTGVRGDVALKIFGPDVAELARLAEAARAAIAVVTGATDTFTLKNEGVQYLQVKVDRAAAGRLGLDAEQIQRELRWLIEGEQIAVVNTDGRRVPLTIRGSQRLRKTPSDLESLRFTTESGAQVALSAVASIEHADGPVKVEREQAQRYAVVQTNVRNRDLVGFVDEARQAVTTAVTLPQGYTLAWGGQFENQQRAASRLALVVPASIALVFFLLFSTFGSLRQALLVLSNIPLALVGGVFGLALTGEYLSVPASVGFIALLGIAVLNGVVMVSYFNQLLERGIPLGAVIVEGARRRLRPVLMTASITAVGLVPLLLSTGPGSEIQRPLAAVVIGGLVSSTSLTLLLLPLLFGRFGLPTGNHHA
jgi:cobalt-zinc-cadmium resistance protein CzcA